MNEYQHYEFRAVDRPLRNDEMAALRRPRRFPNPAPSAREAVVGPGGTRQPSE